MALSKDTNSPDSPLKKSAKLPTEAPLVTSDKVFMVMGKLNGEYVRYPMFSQLAGILRSRGFGVADPSHYGRGLKAAAEFVHHVDNCLSRAMEADAVILLPEALDGRCAALVAEYAVMTGKPLFQASPTGAIKPLDGQEDLPFWATEVEVRAQKKERVLDPIKDVRQ